MSNPKTYAEKLRDPRWQKKRLEIMSRDAFKCRACESDSKILNVHHRVYHKGKNPWEYEDEMLETLCEDCHAKIEGSIRAVAESCAFDPTILRIMSFLCDAKNTAKCHTLYAWIESIARFQRDYSQAHLYDMQSCALHLVGAITDSAYKLSLEAFQEDGGE
jgi:hypothetical protein